MYRPGLKPTELEKAEFFSKSLQNYKIALKYLSQADFQDSAAILTNIKLNIYQERIVGHVNKLSSPVITLQREFKNMKRFIL